jgi:hypothetical protein
MRCLDSALPFRNDGSARISHREPEASSQDCFAITQKFAMDYRADSINGQYGIAAPGLSFISMVSPGGRDWGPCSLLAVHVCDIKRRTEKLAENLLKRWNLKGMWAELYNLKPSDDSEKTQ